MRGVILRRQFRIDEAILSLRIGLVHLHAEDMAAGMNRPQTFEHFLQTLKERDVLLWRQMLITEEDYAVLVQRLADIRRAMRIKWV
jgi:hypothetical protein